jgi:hypothetical protein
MSWSADAGVSVGMKWFRSNIRHGSRIALFALAIQFALSFGHFHALAAPAATGSGAALSAAESAPQPLPSNPDSDQHPNDACAICAVMAMVNTVLFATPPLLLLPQAAEFLYLTTDAGFNHLNAVRVAFQPRAPPIS